MHQIKAAIAGILALFAVNAASAQTSLPYHTVWGRLGAVPGDVGPGQAIPFATLAANLTSTLPVITTTPTVNSSFCGAIAALGGSALYTVTLPAASGFPANCSLTFTNLDTNPAPQREKILSGFPANVLPMLWPGQTVQIVNTNNTWVTKINPGKWRPSSAIVFNVSTTGTDALGCALGTGSAACATGQYAMNLVCQNVDPSLLPNSFPQITIQYATGAYTQAINQFCDPGPLPFVGSTQSGWLRIAGNTNQTSVTLACGSSPCFSPVHSTAGWWIEGFATTGTSGSIAADAGSHLYIGTNKFGTTGASAFDLDAAYGSLVEVEASITTTGSKNFFAGASQSGSRVIFKPVTVTLSSSTFTQFYLANTNGEIIAPWTNVTYSGTATVGASACWVVNTGGGLDTSGSLSPVTAACGGTGNFVTNPGWAQ